MPSFEILLIIGAAGFYIYDSAILLYANELLILRRRNCWGFAAPKSDWLILGKSLYLPNPLTPSTTLFRTSWSSTGIEADKDKSPYHLMNSIAPLKYMVVLLHAMMMAAMPTLILFRGTGMELLFLFGCIYLNILAMLIYIFRTRKLLNISSHSLLIMAIESLACAPFAINLYRKVTLAHFSIGDPIEFSTKYFCLDTHNDLIDNICHSIDEQLEFEELDNARYIALQNYRKRLIDVKK